jgi:hypothetical protein
MVLNTRCTQCGNFLYIAGPCEICEWQAVFAARHVSREEAVLAEKQVDKMTRHFAFVI